MRVWGNDVPTYSNHAMFNFIAAKSEAPSLVITGVSFSIVGVILSTAAFIMGVATRPVLGRCKQHMCSTGEKKARSDDIYEDVSLPQDTTGFKPEGNAAYSMTPVTVV